MINGFHKPNFCIDISEYLSIKVEALEAYESQFSTGSDGVKTPLTEGYVETVIAREKMFGKEVGVLYAEGFMSKKPVLLHADLLGDVNEIKNRYYMLSFCRWFRVVGTELGKQLAERGHEIHFITSGLPFRLNKVYPNIYFHEVTVNQYSVFQYPPYDLALASKMAEVAQRENLDILHVHYAIPHAICAYLAKQMIGERIKIVTTLHGTDITVLGSDPSLNNLIRFGIEQSDVVTAVSHSLINETHELVKPSKEIQTVYNFIDERVYFKRNMSQLKKEYGISESEKVLIHISNFRKVKRVQDVVQAFAKIVKEVDAKLLLVGDGP